MVTIVTIDYRNRPGHDINKTCKSLFSIHFTDRNSPRKLPTTQLTEVSNKKFKTQNIML